MRLIRCANDAGPRDHERVERHAIGDDVVERDEQINPSGQPYDAQDAFVATRSRARPVESDAEIDRFAAVEIEFHNVGAFNEQIRIRVRVAPLDDCLVGMRRGVGVTNDEFLLQSYLRIGQRAKADGRRNRRGYRVDRRLDVDDSGPDGCNARQFTVLENLCGRRVDERRLDLGHLELRVPLHHKRRRARHHRSREARAVNRRESARVKCVAVAVEALRG